MNKIICADYKELSMTAASIVAEQINRKGDSVLGFATGSTPIGTYERLRELYAEGNVDFSRVTAFNLDEYYPLRHDNPQSYYYFMRDKLFGHVNIPPENINIPNGETDDPAKECAEYDKKLAACGGTDLQLLGIGVNGHIGFNEPGDRLSLATCLVDLTRDTIASNRRFFEKEEDVPKQALTMGVGRIMESKHILLLISGKEKAPIAKAVVSGFVSTLVPASLLNLHNNVTVIMDRDAAGGY